MGVYWYEFTQEQEQTYREEAAAREAAGWEAARAAVEEKEAAAREIAAVLRKKEEIDKKLDEVETEQDHIGKLFDIGATLKFISPLISVGYNLIKGLINLFPEMTPEQKQRWEEQQTRMNEQSYCVEKVRTQIVSAEKNDEKIQELKVPKPVSEPVSLTAFETRPAILAGAGITLAIVVIIILIVVSGG